MHNVQSARSVRQRTNRNFGQATLSYVPYTYPPKLSSAPSPPRAAVEGPALLRRCHPVRNALVPALAWCAMAALVGAAAAAPAPLGLGDAQQLAIERSLQMAAYDSAIAAARQ